MCGSHSGVAEDSRRPERDTGPLVTDVSKGRGAFETTGTTDRTAQRQATEDFSPK